MDRIDRTTIPTALSRDERRYQDVRAGSLTLAQARSEAAHERLDELRAAGLVGSPEWDRWSAEALAADNGRL